MPSTVKPAIEFSGLESDVEDLIDSYHTGGKSLVSITYRSPSTKLIDRFEQTMGKARESERTLKKTIAEFRSIDHEVMREYGLSDTPALLRPFEVAKRYISSFLNQGHLDTTMVVKIAGSYVTALESTQHALLVSLKDYERCENDLERYLSSLEEHVISISESKEGVEDRIETLGDASERYAIRTPSDGSLADKMRYQRGKRVLDKDLRGLRTLDLRISNDLNQTLMLIERTKQAAEVLEVSKAMNYLAADLTRGLTGQLKLNIDLYGTSSHSTDIALALGQRLEESSRLSDLLTRGTYSRMSALGSVIKNFSPDGPGAASIAGGGLVEGLKGYLNEMQQLHNEVTSEYERELL